MKEKFVNAAAEGLGEGTPRERAESSFAYFGALQGPAPDAGEFGQCLLGEPLGLPATPECGARHRDHLSAHIYPRQVALADLSATGTSVQVLACASVTGGERIRAARVAAGLSQRVLANRLDVAESTLRNWERDENQAPHDKLIAIAEATGIRGDFFVGQSDTPEFMPGRSVGDAPWLSPAARKRAGVLAQRMAARAEAQPTPEGQQPPENPGRTARRRTA